MLSEWLIRFTGRFMPQMKSIADELGKEALASNQKAKQILGWKPRSNEETIRRTARSLLKLGLVQ
jgi:nucleoside-diphosphate-sugar epimerase